MIELLCFIAFIFYLLMGIYVVMLNSKFILNRIYFFIIIIFSSWILSALIRNLIDSDGSIFLWRIVSYFSLTIGTGVILQFVLALIEKYTFNFKKSLLIYIPGLVIFIGQSYITGFSYINTSSSILDIFFGHPAAYLYYLVYVTIIIFKLLSWGKNSKNRRSIIQGHLISTSLIITTISILIYGIVLPELVNKILPFILPLFTSFWVFAMWLSIVKYDLMTFEKSMAASEIMDNVLDIIVLTDPTGKIIEVNKRVFKLLNYSKKEVVALKATDVLGLYGETNEAFNEILQGKRKSYNNDTNFFGNNDCEIPVRIRIASVTDSSGEVIGVVISAQDLTLETKFKTLSMIDKLTQVFNRFTLDQALDKEIETAGDLRREFCVAICDIDHFKEVNDGFGHQKGDEVLIKIADLLKSHVRETDIVGRWGGEEFLLVFVNCNTTKAKEISAKLKDAIQNYDFGIGRSITASFGIAAFENDDRYDTIINRADDALYCAKSKGRNRVEVNYER